jgi:TRAP-type uncharacterized transport system fused permease subunit
VRSDDAGVAGGLINMTQQVGGAIGLALITAVATSQTHGGASLTTVNDGFRSALVVAAAIAAAGIVVAAVALPGRGPRPLVEPAVAHV